MWKSRKNFFFLFPLLSLFFLAFKQINAYQYLLSNVEIILSDNTPEAKNVEYKFRFKINFPLNSGQKIKILFPPSYRTPPANLSDIFCPPTMEPSIEGRIIYCTVKSGQSQSATTVEVVVKNVENPAKEAEEGIADAHFFTIETDAREGIFFPATILEPMTVRGGVNPVLNFEVRGVDIGETVHGKTINATTSPNLIAFRDIPINTPVLAAQDLFVRTNAAYGFVVFLIQNSDLEAIREDRVYKIYCFASGKCKNYQQASSWIRPEGILGAPQTYGHLGITSEDNSLGENCNQNFFGFGQGGRWAGLTVGLPAEIMRNCQPTDGETQHQGWTRVGFQVEVTPLQPAGEYQTNFSYVITPIF